MDLSGLRWITVAPPKDKTKKNPNGISYTYTANHDSTKYRRLESKPVLWQVALRWKFSTPRASGPAICTHPGEHTQHDQPARLACKQKSVFCREKNNLVHQSYWLKYLYDLISMLAPGSQSIWAFVRSSTVTTQFDKWWRQFKTQTRIRLYLSESGS